MSKDVQVQVLSPAQACIELDPVRTDRRVGTADQQVEAGWASVIDEALEALAGALTGHA